MRGRKIISVCVCVYPSKTDLYRRKRDKQQKGRYDDLEGDGEIGEGRSEGSRLHDECEIVSDAS